MRWLRSALVLAIVLSLWMTPAEGTGNPRAERPTYSVGQRWALEDGLYELVRSEKDRYVFRRLSPAEREIHLSKDLVVTKVKGLLTEWELYPPPALSWPLEVGKWGTRASTLRTVEHSSGINVDVTWEVKAYEDVESPAGRFKAFRITYAIRPEQIERHGRIFPPVTLETWYAPEPRQIVKVRAFGVKPPLDFQVAAIDQGPEAAAPSPPPAAPHPGPAVAPPSPAAPPAPVAGEAQRGRLSVDIRYPDDQARVTEASSVLAAVVTSPKGVAEVRVTLNGAAQVVPKSEQGAARNPTSMAVTVPLTLKEGINAIVVSASESDGTVRHEVRTVIYERPRAVGPDAAPPPAPPADRWAVVIGIGRYERSEIPALRYTVTDAEAVYRALVDHAGFTPDHILLLIDSTEKKPTLRNIKWALGTFLARSAKKDDLVIIYFSGHGAPEVDPRGIESDGLAKYLVPVDADPNDLYSTALPMDELQTIFDRIEARRVVMFLDSCYSGAAGGRTFASKRTRATRVDDLFLDRLTRSSGRAIITAARSAEVSIELPELGHGIFTHYLIQGLRGAADLDRDGIVALHELYQYLEQQVSQKSRAVGGNQHPVMKGEVEGLLPLVTVGGRGAQP
jgi:hypothetical protein